MSSPTSTDRKMNAARTAKEKEIGGIRERFGKATSTVVLDYKGIDVDTVTALRVEFRKAGVEYRVVKNTLVKHALKGTKYEGIKDFEKHLRGMTGFAFSYEDPSAAAKVVKAFRKGGDKQEKLQIKCGLLETSVIPGDKVETDLAGLPGKNELRASLLATLAAPLQNLLQLLQAPGTNLAYALAAREQQLNENKG